VIGQFLKTIFSEITWPNELKLGSNGKSSHCLWQSELKKERRGNLLIRGKLNSVC
jgi:hypothetical protein